MEGLAIIRTENSCVCRANARQNIGYSIFGGIRGIMLTGLKGFEPLTYRCPPDVPMERADKSRSLYLAKLQARGRAYWPSSIKRCARRMRPMSATPLADRHPAGKSRAGSNPRGAVRLRSSLPDQG